MSLITYKLILTFFNTSTCLNVINSTIVTTVYYNCDDDDGCYSCENYAQERNITLNVCQNSTLWTCDVDDNNTEATITVFSSIVILVLFCCVFVVVVL